MARIYQTVGGNWEPKGSTEQLHVYNGLDCLVTLEVLQVIRPKLNEITEKVYAHALTLQGPILEMEARGVKVNLPARGKVLAIFEGRLAEVEASLREILEDGVGVSINWNSPQQLQHLFYEVMGLPPVRKKGIITTDRKALEKLRGYFYAECIVNHILAIRDLKKKIGVLKTGIDADNRIRTSYNIAGTDTGRLSSYQSAFGSGTNLQNITGELRYIYEADQGKKLAYIDLEQAESRGVGAIIWNLFQDPTYLDFCESGDLHTSVCRMTWPELPWTGNLKNDKAIAKQKFYRDFDYRDMAKRLGHGTNYYGQPPHMAKEIRVPVDTVSTFQRQYFKAFPGISEWHAWVKNKLYRDGWITTFMGRHRQFMGRRWEAETLRSAIAFEPQSAVADYLNKGLLAVWKSRRVELLLQVHDAIVFQYDERDENEVVPAVMKMLELEVPLLHGRSLIIPTEAFVGWNWGYTHNAKKEHTNPDGLIAFIGADSRERTKPVAFLDRKFY